ncbi:hypothetical protein [Labrys wisconsinensis]|uniref:Uncharacterized protein n=1 Tax=Labrys wisconsinensis TaxID=425677 RepID=A0ABU0JK33_9HYPH|nr:hypothetical protein [Labrys wisconsinensis]MDQ0473492.1 hypothetical protein [Labrys wisconsinensis]
MQPGSQDPRIEGMYRGDRAWAIGAVVVLWLTVLFVFVQILPDTGTSAVVAALAVAGGLVLLFNTASITALVRHYREDKSHIYGLDLHYLDEMKNRK